MNIEEIKTRFKHKVKADIKDIDIALKALPFLIREVERLEGEAAESEKRIEHLTRQMKKRPPLEASGNKGNSGWDVRVDEKKNRLYIKLSGRFDYKVGKIVSNNISTLLSNVRQGFDVINDISELSADYEKKAVFHLRKIMHYVKEAGVNKIIRIINPQLPELAHLFEAHAQAAGYDAYSANSLNEAEAILDNVSRFLKA